MGRKKKDRIEFRYYELPPKEPVLALTDASWRRKYASDGSMMHFHNLMEIGCCLDGKGVLRLDGMDHAYHSDMISIIPARYPHVTVSGGEGCYWNYLFFDPEQFLNQVYPNDTIFVSQLLNRINQRAHLIDATEKQRFARILRSMIEESKEKQEYYVQAMRGYLLTLLLEIARMNPESGKEEPQIKSSFDQVSASLRYVDQHYMEGIRIKDLSEVCHMSETHFRRVFEEYINMTPVEYLNLVRIQKACDLMKTTRSSMDEIAQKVGYNSTSTFNRNFREIAGTSPYQWKKNPDNYEAKLLNFNISALKGW